MEPTDCKERWQKLIEADQAFEELRREFMESFSEAVVPLVREALNNPEHRSFAFRIALLLPMQYRYQLFNDFLSFACEPSYIPTIMSAREVLVTLPTPWVVEQMEVAADSVLPTADEWVWRRFMEMAAYLDRDLTLSLAERAMRHPDAEIRDAGADFRDNPRPPSVKFP